jgi:GTP-binding protein LepA
MLSQLPKTFAFAPSSSILPRGSVASATITHSTSSLVPRNCRLHVLPRANCSLTRPAFCNPPSAPLWTVVRAAATSASAVVGDAPVPYQRIPADHIRNLSIVAHVDHGKSTLADRLLEATGTVTVREMKAQYMDTMDLERERGITIKLNAARLMYTHPDEPDIPYVINIIDTPGHVDFTYEVSRSLQACEGALLVVDASQGIEAQTLSNVYLALEANLELIPILNKIDLPGAEPQRVATEIETVIGLDVSDIIHASGKAGIGIDEILQRIVRDIPPPKDRPDDPLTALIFDSIYDPYRGVIVYFRVISGSLKQGAKINFMQSGKQFHAEEIGVMSPKPCPCDELRSGEVGYLIAGIKTVRDARVGDTITNTLNPAREALPGYSEAKPMLFAGMFPVDADQYEQLKVGFEKLKLNDAALQYEVENSAAMGYGFRVGLLGMLHMEIVQERLEREFGLDIICTAPSVVYGVKTTAGEEYFLDNPADLPPPTKRESMSEPYITMSMHTPEEYVGTLMELAQGRRGEFVDMRYLTLGRTTLVYELPLAEVVGDYFDHLKSRSKGYASMEYQLSGYRVNDLARLDVAINGDPVDAMSCIVHRDKLYAVGKNLVTKLKVCLTYSRIFISRLQIILRLLMASNSTLGLTLMHFVI